MELPKTMYVSETDDSVLFESQPIKETGSFSNQQIEDSNQTIIPEIFGALHEGLRQGSALSVPFHQALKDTRSSCARVGSNLARGVLSFDFYGASDYLLGQYYNARGGEIEGNQIHRMKLTYYMPTALLGEEDEMSYVMWHTDYSTEGRSEDLRLRQGKEKREIVSMAVDSLTGELLRPSGDPPFAVGTLSVAGLIGVPKANIWTPNDLPLGRRGDLDENTLMDQNPDEFMVATSAGTGELTSIIRAPIGWDPPEAQLHQLPPCAIGLAEPRCLHTVPLLAKLGCGRISIVACSSAD